jgi:hypothetical protein
MQNQCRPVTHRFKGVFDNILTIWPQNGANDPSNRQGFVECAKLTPVNEERHRRCGPRTLGASFLTSAAKKMLKSQHV